MAQAAGRARSRSRSRSPGHRANLQPVIAQPAADVEPEAAHDVLRPCKWKFGDAYTGRASRLNALRWSEERSLRAAISEIALQDAACSIEVSGVAGFTRLAPASFPSPAAAVEFLQNEEVIAVERERQERDRLRAQILAAENHWLELVEAAPANPTRDYIKRKTEAWVSREELDALMVRRDVLCGRCDGRGRPDPNEMDPCLACQGSGLATARPPFSWHVRQFVLNRARNKLVSFLAGKASQGLREFFDLFLSEQGKYAAMSAAAYYPDSALEQLKRVGVLNTNWTLDQALSCAERTIFVNKFTHEVVQAERGTADSADIAETWGPIAVGIEENNARFQRSRQAAQNVMDKYGKGNLTFAGHSLGAGIADKLGREHGVPVYGYNPGIGLRAFLQNDKVANLNHFRAPADPVSFVASKNITMTEVKPRVNKGLLDAHGYHHFLQDRALYVRFLVEAASVVGAAMASAKVSAKLTGELLNNLVAEETHMSGATLEAAVRHATVVGTAAGSLAAGAAAALGTLPITTTTTAIVSAPGIWGSIGYTIPVVQETTTTLAAAHGTTAAGVALAAAPPVAALAASAAMAHQFGRVPLTEALGEWRRWQLEENLSEDVLFFKGSVQNDLILPKALQNDSRWKGFAMSTGVLAVRHGSILSGLADPMRHVWYGCRGLGASLGMVWIRGCKLSVHLVVPDHGMLQ